MISDDYIYFSNYEKLKHHKFVISQSHETIVWIYDNHRIYFKCYALPKTIQFCQYILKEYHEHGSLENVKTTELNSKSKLIYLNFQSFVAPVA